MKMFQRQMHLETVSSTMMKMTLIKKENQSYQKAILNLNKDCRYTLHLPFLFQQGRLRQALLQEHQRLTTADIKPVDELGSKDERSLEKMSFKVLLKKGGKDDKSRKLEVPMSVTMAIRQKEHDTQEAADRTLIKERVLAAHEKDEEEELLNAGFLFRSSRGNKGRHDGRDGPVYGGRRYKRR